MVAGRESSSLALIASFSLSFTSSISPEASYVAGLQGFSPTTSALGSSAIVKVSGQNDTFVFWDSLVFWGKWLLIPNRFCAEKGGPRFFTFVSQAAVASEKVLWEVLPAALYICLPVSVWGQSCVKSRHLSPIPLHSAENDLYHHCCGKCILDPY